MAGNTVNVQGSYVDKLQHSGAKECVLRLADVYRKTVGEAVARQTPTE